MPERKKKLSSVHFSRVGGGKKQPKNMAPKDVKLIYLEGRGRAEVARMLLVSYITMAETRIFTL